jgi:type 1 glutamine amidotransferase
VSPRNLVISGGPLHDFAATTAALVDLADAAGFASVVPDDPREALDLLGHDPTWELVTVNALLWQMPAERHAPLREEWAFVLDDAHADALHEHVVRGGGLLACHTAPICFDGHPRWRSLLGASWDWARSHHPPPSRTAVRPTQAGRHHPITARLDDFEVVDEVYAGLDLEGDVVPLLTAEVDGSSQPVLWARTVGSGRVVVDLLGHDHRSLDAPGHVAALAAAIAWLVTDTEPTTRTPSRTPEVSR